MNMNDLIRENIFLINETLNSRFKTVADSEKDCLYSAGLLGLYKASESFDHSRGKSFTTYARTCVRNEMYSEVRNIQRRNNGVIASLDIDVSTREDSDSIYWVENIQSNSPSTEDNIILKELRSILTGIISTFREKDKLIAMHYLGLMGYTMKKQVDIVQILGFNKVEVSRSVKKALSIIRPVVENYLNNKDTNGVQYLYSIQSSINVPSIVK